jgi:hypothetical protein
VSFTLEIHVVGLSCIVVGIEMTEVLQLSDATAFAALNVIGEPCRDTAPTTADGATRYRESCSFGKPVKSGPKTDHSEPHPKRNVETQGARAGRHRNRLSPVVHGFNARMFDEVAQHRDPSDYIASARYVYVSNAWRTPRSTSAWLQLPQQRLKTLVSTSSTVMILFVFTVIAPSPR